MKAPDSTFAGAVAPAIVRHAADADAAGRTCLRQIVGILWRNS